MMIFLDSWIVYRYFVEDLCWVSDHSGSKMTRFTRAWRRTFGGCFGFIRGSVVFGGLRRGAIA